MLSASHTLNAIVSAGFESMAGAHSSMLEDANRIANRDQVSLEQVQQTAASGEAHVQGMPLTLHMLD